MVLQDRPLIAKTLVERCRDALAVERCVRPFVPL